MKKIFSLVTLFASLVACTDFSMENQGFRFEELPESIFFNAPGNSYNADGEGREGATTSLFVIAISGALSDIVVTYSLAGTATFGTDYTIEGATAEGGSVTIKYDPDDKVNFDNGEIMINLLTDTDDDDEETIIITLTSATRGSESIAVGRGGRDFGNTATITITDTEPSISLTPSSSLVSENSGDTVSLFVRLNVSLTSAVSYDVAISSESSVPDTGYELIETSLGTRTIEANEQVDTLRVRIIDNKARGTSTKSYDSLIFMISNISLPNINAESNVATLKIQDDIKECAFNLSPNSYTFDKDTIVITKIGLYTFPIALFDTLTRVVTPGPANATVSYSITPSDEAVVLTDYVDNLSGGTATIAAGSDNGLIVIRITRVGQESKPTFSIIMNDITSADTEDNEIIGIDDRPLKGELTIRIE